MDNLNLIHIIVSTIFGLIGGLISAPLKRWGIDLLYESVGKIKISVNSYKFNFLRKDGPRFNEVSELAKANCGGEIVLDLDLINEKKKKEYLRNVFIKFTDSTFSLKNELKDLKKPKRRHQPIVHKEIKNIILLPEEVKNMKLKSYFTQEELEKIYRQAEVYLCWENKKGKIISKKLNIL